MSGSVRKKPRGPQFLAERRQTRRLTKRGLYEAARSNYPNQSEFGAAEHVDSNGTEYRVAIADRPLGWAPGKRIPPATREQRARAVRNGIVSLWVRLPHNSGLGGWIYHVGQTILLQPTQMGLGGQTCVVVSAQRTRATGREGVLRVTGYV